MLKTRLIRIIDRICSSGERSNVTIGRRCDTTESEPYWLSWLPDDLLSDAIRSDRCGAAKIGTSHRPWVTSDRVQVRTGRSAIDGDDGYLWRRRTTLTWLQPPAPAERRDGDLRLDQRCKPARFDGGRDDRHGSGDKAQDSPLSPDTLQEIRCEISSLIEDIRRLYDRFAAEPPENDETIDGSHHSLYDKPADEE